MSYGRKLIPTVSLAATFVAAPASAQFWNALDTVPKANVIFGIDTSVTMRIESDCSDCHKVPLDSRQRMFEAVQDLRRTLPLFDDSFAYGAFAYSGSGSAHIRGGALAPLRPDPTNITSSYSRVFNFLGNLTTEGSGEKRLPGGEAVSCITPTAPTCNGDAAVLTQILNNTLPGLTLPTITRTTTVCSTSNAAFTQINPFDEFRRLVSGYDWPRYNGTTVTPGEIEQDFCVRLRETARVLQQELSLCSRNPGSLVDVNSLRCDPATLSASICSGASPFANTCVCDPTAAGCGGGSRTSDCGVRYDFKVRQQYAICYAHNPDPNRNGFFGPTFASQPDNVVQPRQDVCRENALLMFTDGYRGGSQGVRDETALARRTFRNRRGESNMYVFRVARPFTDQSNDMATIFNDGVRTEAYDATNGQQMLNSFATLANRILAGTYTGANLATDRHGKRVAIHIFSVPDRPFETYLGRPSRIAWHEIDDRGRIVAEPIFETDWETKVPEGSNRMVTIGGGLVEALGPNGRWRSRVPKVLDHPASSLDRNGDERPDQHPALTWGYMLGGGASQPVIVEAPRELPTGVNGAALAAYLNDPTIRERPRVVYTVSNGYLHAIHAGAYRNRPPAALASVGARKTLDFAYDDRQSGGCSDFGRDSECAGVEMWRYRPAYIDRMPAGFVGLNDVVQRDVINGQVAAREVQIRAPARDDPRCERGSRCFATLLVMAQGRPGRFLSGLDVTDPEAPRVLWEAALPDASDRATAEPMLYDLPMSGTTPNPAVVVTGGLGGSRNIYALNALTGALLSRAALPGAADYPVSPVCVDTEGAGVVSFCYAVSRDGTLARIPVGAGGRFGAAEDITPAGIRGASRVFTTRPAVFFGTDNNVNLVYGSGSVERLEAPDGIQNVVAKVVDRIAGRRAPATTDGVCHTSSGGTGGLFNLASGERLISPPTVSKGVVAWTTYTPGSTGCVAGTGRLYGIDFETCTDQIDRNNRSRANLGKDIGAGIHTSPVLLRGTETILAHSSADPTAQAAISRSVETRGRRQEPIKRLYWRPVLGVP